jgi:serine/threonine protein kinase
MAPEGWRIETNTKKIDVYSVGLVFYQILTLKHPLESAVNDSSDPQAWRQAHLGVLCKDVREYRKEVGSSWAQLLLRMVKKKPEDRPDWDEIIKVIEGSEEFRPKTFDISPAVEAALKASQALEKKQLDADRRIKDQEERKQLFKLSCDEVLELLDEVVDAFNANFQGGKITIRKKATYTAAREYELSAGKGYVCGFFEVFENDIKLQGLTEPIIGAGYLGPPDVYAPFSGNLLLVRQSSEDLYGGWRIVLLKKVINLTNNYITVEDAPFGAQTQAELLTILTRDLSNPLTRPPVRTDIQTVFTQFLQNTFTKNWLETHQ